MSSTPRVRILRWLQSAARTPCLLVLVVLLRNLVREHDILLEFAKQIAKTSNPLKMKSEYPDRPVVSVGAVVVCDGRVLIVKRATEPGRGMWSVFGGKVELGETLRESIIREVREETGIAVDPIAVLDASDAVYPDSAGSIQFHAYSSISSAGPPEGTFAQRAMLPM